jgi:hypothetical protein
MSPVRAETTGGEPFGGRHETEQGGISRHNKEHRKSRLRGAGPIWETILKSAPLAKTPINPNKYAHSAGTLQSAEAFAESQ